MEDLIQYILSEVKVNRIGKQESLRLISQLKLPYYYSEAPRIISVREEENTYEYDCTLSRHDFFIADHTVNNSHLLSGAACLELVRTAFSLCNKEADHVSFSSIVWSSPLIMDQVRVQVNICITQEEKYSHFEISSIKDDNERIVNCQGTIGCIDEAACGIIDFDSYEAKGIWNRISRTECYEEFRKSGFCYGISHKAIEELLVNEQTVLARLQLPSFLNEGAGRYFIHPSMLDAAFQAAAGFEYHMGTSYLPFSIECMDVRGKCTSDMRAIIQKDADCYNDLIHKMNVKLLNDQGETVIDIRGFVCKNQAHVQISKDEQMETMLKKLLAKTIKYPVNRIRSQEFFDTYGIDSVLILKMTKELEKQFGPLSKTLFFEHQTIEELAQYFIGNYGDKIPDDMEKNDVRIIEEQIETGKESIKELNYKIEETEIDQIAIIGVAGKYPEAESLEEFWSNLKEGKDSVSEIPQERWNHEIFFDKRKDVEGKTYAKWGGFISDVDTFDAMFFHISPHEAERMDPQERLFLECVYHAIEDAGYTRDTLDGGEHKVGVFAGVMYEEYQLYGAEDTVMGSPASLSGSNASIANRVSYFCDFHGPSISLDTMCSSSLTAVHLACQMLKEGDCNVAIAGGVNVSIHPNKFLMLAQDHFASSKGKCESFGSGGDGYVPGEGVGAVILKPLSNAVRDQDHIYGIIRGTAVNHGGRTNGYSVPNPKAQENVIAQALQKARINPRTISYVEAHGTGTSLGDPIEISGLTKTFGAFTKDTQFCSIGSVKSNIGHCESAAGIAGITKVLLQMKYKELAPSLHAKQLNPNIDFDQTPFYVQQTLEEWSRPSIEEKGKLVTYPRRAGISSFGAGGSNAHVIIEEYIEQEQHSEGELTDENKIIVISARNESRLKESIEMLFEFLQKKQVNDAMLQSISFTFAVGREAKEERLGFIVKTADELKNILYTYLHGQEGTGKYFVGSSYDLPEIEQRFVTKKSKEQTIAYLLKQKDVNSLLDLWCKGVNIEWGSLFDGYKVKRMPLPLYPFEKKRYWYPKQRRYGQYSAEQRLHPLIHKNISTFASQRFASHITGNELVTKDHKIGNERIVPGAVYIEMVISAIHLSLEKMEEKRCHIRIRQMYWNTPLSLEQGEKDLVIALDGGKGNEIPFTITEKDMADDVICEGIALLSYDDSAFTLIENAMQWSGNKRTITKSECYEDFRQNGLCYGENFQCIETMELEGNQLTAQVRLKDAVKDTVREYWLHPLVLDGAFQAVAGFYMGSHRQLLPFFVEEINVMNAPEAVMRVDVKKVSGQKEEDQFEISLVNDVNKVCCEIRGFLLKEKKDKKKEADKSATPFLMNQVWQLSGLQVCHVHHEWEKRYVFYADDLCLKEEAYSAPVIIKSCHFDRNRLGESFEEFALELFSAIKECVISKPRKDIMIQVVIAHDNNSHILSGLIGMLRTATIENPSIKTQLLEVNHKMEADQLIKLLETELLRTEDTHIRYQDGQRYIPVWKEADVGLPVNPCMDQGVYLITGGCGGLGFLFAKELLRDRNDVSLILAGRSPFDDRVKSKIEELTQIGGNVDYIQADVTREQDVQELIGMIRERYPRLNGIIHSAGITRDNFIIRKSEEEFLEVLGPKVRGTIYLDKYTKNINLDFFALFASGTGAFGNMGQIDYAAANGFMDAFAVELKGKVLSIDWPLWKDGGMHVNEETQISMIEEMGLSLLDTQAGIQSFYRCFGTGQHRLFVAQGNKEKIRSALFKEDHTLLQFFNDFSDYFHIVFDEMEDNIPLCEYGLDELGLIGFIQHFSQQYKKKVECESASLNDTLMDLFHKLYRDDALSDDKQTVQEVPISRIGSEMPETRKRELKQVETFVKSLLCPIVKLSAEEMESRVDLEDYGLNSVMVLKFNQKLEVIMGQVSKTILYEYKNISALADYLLQKYRKQLCDKAIIDMEPAVSDIKMQSTAFFLEEKSKENETEPDEPGDIAIIGLAGKYPKADNMEQFWENLRQGTDCIVEIPKDRWNHDKYYAKDKEQVGKTYGKWGGFLEGAYEFDPEFFHISPREAYLMDPQERLFLQCAYEAVEDAGYTKQSMKTAQMEVGVYAGVMYDEYQLYSLNKDAVMDASAISGNTASIANRVSYLFDFSGPSIVVNTMCSSSLTTIHLACQSLKLQECDMAIAGGVNLSVHPNKYLALGQGRFLSSKGRCQAFGEGGDGYVPGEGVGAVLLKPLKRAVEDHDHIYAVIKGSGISHGGKTNGYTVPSPSAQAKLIKKVYEKAKVNTRCVSYIEAHGTGTLLGDPIEMEGLKSVFGMDTQDRQFCPIGSVKSNIGHCESAAGIAAVSKVLLQFKHKKIAASLYSNTLNPNIDFGQSPFYVQQSLSDWKRPVINGKEQKRYAGVSAFGAGGSNAHIILEEFEEEGGGEAAARDSYYIVLSAKDQDGLYRQTVRLHEFIDHNPIENSDLLSLSYTLMVGRDQMEARLALLCSSISELTKQLEQYINREEVENGFVGNYFDLSELPFDFEDEDEIKRIMDEYAGTPNEIELFKLWVSGGDLDFKLLFREPYPKKMSLPAYPFKQRLFFINEQKKQQIQNTSEEAGPLCMKESFISRENTKQEKGDCMEKIKLEPLSVYQASSMKAKKTFIVDEEQIRRFLIESLADVLYMDQSDLKEGQKFVDLGLDSVVGVEWIKLINKQYGLKLPATKIYDYPTVNDFAKLLAEQMYVFDASDLIATAEECVDASKPVADLEDELLAGLADVLYMEKDQIQTDKKFVDMGLDSVVGVEWIKWVNKNYSIKIPATKIYDFPTIKAFADYLSGILKETGQQEQEQIQERERDVRGLTEGVMSGEKGLVLREVSSVDEITLGSWKTEFVKPYEVKIEVKASSINYPDIMCINGIYPTIPEYPFVPGFEVAGVIAEVGESVIGFRVGDEVIAITGKNMGGHSDYVNVAAEEIIRKPFNISFEEACSLPIVFATVAYAFEVGKVRKNEHILIQAATGGIGLMALQFAHLYQCITYGTSSKQEKLQLLKQLGVDHIFNYVKDPFEEIIRSSEHGGVDVVLNTLPGEVIQKGLQALAPSGRYLELAVHGLKAGKKLDLSMLVDNQEFISIDLRKMALTKKICMKDYMEQMVQMVEKGLIAPIVSRIYPMERVKEAMQYVSDGRHIGKVVITHQGKNNIDLSEKCLNDINLLKSKNAGKFMVGDDVSGGRISEMKAVNEEHECGNTFAAEGIAIIGMDGVFPDADNVEDFFENLKRGKNCVYEVPQSRFCMDDYYDEDRRAPGKTYSKWMGHVKGIYEFDPLFFNISPAEAQLMEPQQRLFLQSSFKCFEDAGLKAGDIEGSKCGIFAGCAGSDYGMDLEEENYTVQSLLGQSTSILAARIAYLLDLKGPCLSIETACSSSLVAIASACDSLILHNCDLALAGGVYTISSPLMHIRASKAGMLSPDGRCHTFDNEANGFVPGEGVGTLLLKRLSDAERDHDHIYGVIRGWGVNQDGKTNGITAPSVQSQIELEKEVYKKFSINPESITYVEAHGTGTKLGDPIEVEALTTAFREFTERKNYCAIGSVKTNIGHLLMAAGVASVIKVLQSMRYKRIPALVNYHQINEHITLEGSPFYINQETIDWVTKENEKRMAAVSAFGFSGTNAHIVLEEYEDDTEVKEDANEVDKIFVLSASNEEQLKEYSGMILNYIGMHREIDLKDLNYTVKIGRNEMDCRMAIYAEDKEDLLTQLKGYWNNSDNRQNWKQCKEDLLVQAIKDYLDGSLIPWKEYYAYRQRRRIHLPGYPFLKEIYHVKRKDSSQSEQSIYEFTKTLTGEEPFLRDHRIGEDKVLPASAYIELVLKYLKNIPGNAGGKICLSNLLWKSPIIVKEKSVSVKISFRKEDAKYRFTVRKEESEDLICCEGEIGNADLAMNRDVSLTAWDRECSLAVYSQEQCYASFEQVSMNYGVTHRGISELSVGKEKAWAKMKIDDPGFSPCQIHSGLLDSAMQAIAGFFMYQDTIGRMKVFAIGEVIMIDKCCNEMYALIHRKENLKFDVEICDYQGGLCVAIHDVELYTEEKKDTSVLFLAAEHWEEKKREASEKEKEKVQQKVIFLGFDESEDHYGGQGFSTDSIKLNCKISQPKQFMNAATLVFDQVKKLMEGTEHKKIKLQLVVPYQKEFNFYRAFYSLMKTITLENPVINAQMIELDEAVLHEDFEEFIRQDSYDDVNTHIQYCNGVKSVKQWQKIDINTLEQQMIFKNNGVYVIFGGAKGVGFLFAREIARQIEDGVLILAGRSHLNSTIERNMNELGHSKIHIVYESVDVCDRQQVQNLYSKVTETYGTVNGILFGAGILKDNFIVHKSMQEYSDVIRPKVEGVVHVDEVFSDEKLDFFLLFSSVASCMGNTGQADYALANGFLNEYAGYRNSLTMKKKRHGKTVAMDWSLWEEGGFRMDGRADLKRAVLSTNCGIQSVYYAFSSGRNSIIAMEGREKEIEEFWEAQCGRKQKNFYRELTELVQKKLITKEEFKRRLIGQGG